jgi:hypothetical protein
MFLLDFAMEQLNGKNKSKTLRVTLCGLRVLKTITRSSFRAFLPRVATRYSWWVVRDRFGLTSIVCHEYTPARSADRHRPEAHWRNLSILSPAVTATGTTFCAA